MIEEKIQHIIDKATTTNWLLPENQNCLVLQIYTELYYLIATNKKIYETMTFGVVTISREEEKYTYSMNVLKNKKLENAKKILKNYIENQLSKRTGLKGYKGYFKFIDIKEMPSKKMANRG